MKPLKKLNEGINDSKKSNGTCNSNSITTASPSTDTNIPTSAASDHRITQNFRLIWLDSSIDEDHNNDTMNTIIELREVVNTVNKFIDVGTCINFMATIKDEKAFVIVSGSLGKQFIPNIHDLSQVDVIYIFCTNKFLHEEWTKEWIKIKGIYNDIKFICQALQQAVEQCNQDSIAMSFTSIDEEVSDQNLNQLEPSFMYTQLFKDTLLEIEHDEKFVKDLTIYCRKFYHGNMRELNIINEFEHDYHSKSPIWWYTRQCFTYQMLNRALRTLESDTIINMGFFIRDLHEQIQKLHQKQLNNYNGKTITLYRGQGLLKADFEKILKTKGGLMSFNNFLSTSTKREVSLCFAKSALTKTDMVGILFTLTIDPSVSSAPYASIQEVSYYKTEEETLFSTHTVFRIGEINEIDNNNSLYQVNLKLTSDDDQQLRTLTERIRQEIVDGTRWQRLGQLLVKLNQFDKAEELYKVLFEETSDENEKALYYNNIAYIKMYQGNYEEAIEYYEKMREIFEKTLPTNHPYVATSYNNIGELYRNMGEYSKSLSFYEKGLEIREKTLPSNHPELAASYNNIACVYVNMGEYSKALPFYEKMREIFEETLPPNHPDLATSYNNIGELYRNMGEYFKAISFHDKVLKIREKTLPPNHPHFAQSYNNIGLVYHKMGEYSKALSFYEKMIEINQKTLGSDHPDLAKSYNNIGLVYDSMGEYSKALLFYEKTVEIRQKILPSNHSDLAQSYNNIGLVYNNMGEYSKALSFYEKDLDISQKVLPPNHPDLAISYNNIAWIYRNTEEYSKALSYFESALDIRQKSLPSNHPSIQDVRKSIEFVKEKLSVKNEDTTNNADQ